MMEKSRTLLNGMKLPAIGFGTYKVGGKETEIIVAAIRAGYRLIDTASIYGTERAVGEAAAQSGMRDQLLITTKAWRTELGYDNVLRAFDRSLSALKMDYVDIYLLHWPARNDEVDRESWRAAERLYDEGAVRAIGVSNYLVHHLENLLAVCHTPPMIDQLEFHPGYPQWDTVRFAQRHGICVEAWSPLGRRRLTANPLLMELAEKYHVTTQQLCLAFAVQCGVVPLPKSSDPERIRQNITAACAIEQGDMERILAMPQAGWSGEHPDVEPDK